MQEPYVKYYIIEEKRILSIGPTKKLEDQWKLTFGHVKLPVGSNTTHAESIAEQSTIGIEEFSSDLVSQHTVLVEGFTGTKKQP